jgi:hypothetical protein
VIHQLNTPTLDFGGKVWKGDSGTNRVVKQLVDIKRHIGQQMDDPFCVRALLANKFQHALTLKSARNLSTSSSVLMRCGTSKNLELFWLEPVPFVITGLSKKDLK